MNFHPKVGGWDSFPVREAEGNGVEKTEGIGLTGSDRWIYLAEMGFQTPFGTDGFVQERTEH